MIKVVGTTLVNDGKVIKSLSGAYGDGKIRVSKKDYKLYVGGLVFPLSPLNKLSFTLDGLTQMVNSKLAVTLDLMWHSIETITINTVVNLTPGQQVTFILQHGDTSYVTNNLTVQTFNIPFQEGKDFIVTALNFMNGAMSTLKLDVSPGQAYDLAAVTTAENLGEEVTTGGELISGGDVTYPCVRQGYVIKPDTPVLLDWVAKVDGRSSSPGFGGYLSRDVLEKAMQDHILDLQMGLNSSGLNTSGDNYTLEYKKYADYANSQHTIYNATTMTNTAQPANAIFSPTTSGTYGIFTPAGSSGISERLFGTTNTNNIFAEADLIADKGYYFDLAFQVVPLNVEITDPPNYVVVNQQAVWDAQMNVQTALYAQLRIYGPMDLECLQTETIDTRWSYVTPVVTTDTRRTVYTIEIDATALN